MVKNALQAQLLKAGLVDNKKAKKLSKQTLHEQRTGESKDAEVKAKIAQAQQEKVAKDQAIEQEKESRFTEKRTESSNYANDFIQHKFVIPMVKWLISF